MPQNTGTVRIEIVVDDKGTVKVKRFGDQTDKALKRTGKSVTDFDKKLAGTNTTLTKMGSLVGALAGTYGLMKLVSALEDCVKAASDLEEVTSKFNVVFAEQAKQAEIWAQALVDGYAMSTREARQYLASVQDLLVPMGMQAEAAAYLSNEIVKLSADLGSFNNLPTAKVMEDIQSALVGNYETMKKYGVVINATIVQEHALAMGLAATKDELTVAQKAYAAYQLIVEGSTAAIGDQERTQKSYANQVKRLKANIEELRVEIGRDLLPVLSSWLKKINAILKAWNRFVKGPSAIDIALETMETQAEKLRIQIGTIEAQIRAADAAGSGWGNALGINVEELQGKLKLLNKELKDTEASIQFWKLEKVGAIAPGMVEDIRSGAGGMPDMSGLTGGATQKGFQMGQDMWSTWAGAAEWGWQDDIVNYENALTTKIDMTAEHFRQMKELTAGNQQEMAEIYRQAAAQIEAIEAQKRDMLISSAGTIADRVASAGQLLMSASNKQNKTLFAITKAAAISSAIVNTYKAVMLAKASAPPPINYALAAAEMAYGMAQVAKIQSQSYGAMAGGGGAVGTYAASPVTGIPTGSTSAGKEEQKITLVFKGNSGGDAALMDFLIEKLNDSVEVRGARVVATEIA